MSSRIRVAAVLVAFGILGLPGQVAIGQRSQAEGRGAVQDFDVRTGRPPASPTPQAAEEMQRAAAGSRGRLRLHPHTGAVRVLEAPGLAANPRSPAAAVRALIATSHAHLGLDRRDLDSLDLVRDYTSASTGLRHLVFNQVFDGIPVLDAIVSFHLDANGVVVRATSSAASGRARPLEATVPAEDAAMAAAADVRPDLPYVPSVLEGPTGPRRTTRFARGPFLREVVAALTWFPMDGSVRLAWQIEIEPPGEPQLYDVLIDASSGELLLRRNRVRTSGGQGRIIQSAGTHASDARRPDPAPAGLSGCPPPANHELRDLSAPFRDPSTVLFGTGRLEGNNTQVLRGNTSTPSEAGTFDGTAWTFDFPFNSAGAAETALFFALNYAHDFFYDLGFDEASGNFQVDNFGRGGAAGDSIHAVARADGRNNATFLPAPDGTSPVISMFLWDGWGCWADDVDGDGTLDVDGDFDLDIVLHEFHHGVSHRLNTAFTGAEADAIGEGGSDFFAYSVNGDTTLAEYSYAGGIRRVNAKTYADWSCFFGFFCQPHANGEIFANVLWDVRERLLLAMVRGSEAAAVNESHQLYVDALKLSPPAPTMLDMRDAMLQADALRNPDSPTSANYCRIWESFARRGMGTGATDTADNGSNQVGADFGVPQGCTPPPAPPVVTVQASVPTAYEAGPADGGFTISRPAADSQALLVTVSFSGTATKGADYVTPPTTVTIPAGAVSADVVIAPIDDAALENNETVVLSLKAGPGYTVGAPSSATVTIVSDDTAPDFIVTAFDAPDVAGAGETVQVSDTAKNQGTGGAAASKTWFYLSTNTLLDGGDAVVGSRDVPPLAVGASSAGTAAVTIPAATAAGLYYLLAVADGPGDIVETNESNNRRSTSIRVGPDLAVAALSVPASAGAGGSISVSDTTKNQGGGGAGASTTRFYLSTNYALDPSDTPLQARAVGALAPNASSAGTTMVTIPAGTATGTYYLIAAADDGAAVDESSESNNTRSVSFRIGPDLQVSALSAPKRAAGGTAIAVTETTKNAAEGSAGPSLTAFYLSANGALDADDIRLTPARAVGPLASGATSSGTTMVDLPGVQPGLWYLIAKADDEAGVDETFESNNTRSVSMLVGPDLDVTAVSAPSTAVAGATITVSDTVKNLGAATAPSSTTYFYLSQNFVLDAGDLQLNGQRAVPALGENATSAGSTVITLPAGTSGVFYIIAVADGPGAIAESSETNNTAYRKITINP